MAKIIESLAVVNSTVRTLLGVVVVGGVSVGAWFGYDSYQQGQIVRQTQVELDEARTALEQVTSELDQSKAAQAQLQQQARQQKAKITELSETVRVKDVRIEQLDTALRLLRVDHRVARMSVIEQAVEPATGQLRTRVEFVELDDQGVALDATRQFTIDGDVVFIDSWIVKFEDKYIERNDLHRSTSLVLFRRLFGENQEPRDGFVLDPVGSRPRAYGDGAMSGFEQRIWDEFWNIANDAHQAQKLGIRAAHGEAPSIKVRPGKSYLIHLRASDGLSITPDDGRFGPAT